MISGTRSSAEALPGIRGSLDLRKRGQGNWFYVAALGFQINLASPKVVQAAVQFLRYLLLLIARCLRPRRLSRRHSESCLKQRNSLRCHALHCVLLFQRLRRLQ